MEEPRWLRRHEVDLFQRRSVERFGGSPGVRDSGLVDSALARPVQRWTYDPSCDLPALAASYAYGLAKNHGYVDGNKRIAFIALGVFLYLNGFLLEAPDEEAIAWMLGLASGERGGRGGGLDPVPARPTLSVGTEKTARTPPSVLAVSAVALCEARRLLTQIPLAPAPHPRTR